VTIIYLVIGLAAGVLSGILGIGGGILIVPSLIFFTKMAPKTATGTSLGALLLPVGALAIYSYYKDGHVDVRAALLVAFGLFIGAYGGAQLARSLSEGTVKKTFAVFLVLVAARMWVSSS
jgi:uncharacterized membrane protein YfcA